MNVTKKKNLRIRVLLEVYQMLKSKLTRISVLSVIYKISYNNYCVCILCVLWFVLVIDLSCLGGTPYMYLRCVCWFPSMSEGALGGGSFITQSGFRIPKR